MRDKDTEMLEEAYGKILEAFYKPEIEQALRSARKYIESGQGVPEEIVSVIKQDPLAYQSYRKMQDVVGEEFDEDLMRGSTNMPHGQGYPNVSEQDREFDNCLFVDNDGQYPAFVTAYDITREFGGQEEGGWYYTQYTPMHSIPISSNEEIEANAKKLYDKLSDSADGKFRIYVEVEKGSQAVDTPHYE